MLYDMRAQVAPAVTVVTEHQVISTVQPHPSMGIQGRHLLFHNLLSQHRHQKAVKHISAKCVSRYVVYGNDIPANYSIGWLVSSLLCQCHKCVKQTTSTGFEGLQCTLILVISIKGR